MDNLDQVQGWADDLVVLATTYGMSVIGAIVMLIAGWIVAGWAHRTSLRMMSRTSKIDETLRPVLAGVLRYGILFVTLIAVLDQFGVQTASLIAVLGAAGLAVGLALQGTLSNVAAGIMLLLFRPFRVGQYIDAGGIAGTVKEIKLFTTDLDTPDNVRIVAPNASLWGSAIRNFSHHPIRRCDFLFGIAYEDDIGKAIALIGEEIGKDGRGLNEPAAPFIAVSELADSSVNVVVRVWCNSADYWNLKFELTRAVKERFDAEGITIPYPQRTVRQAAG